MYGAHYESALANELPNLDAITAAQANAAQHRESRILPWRNSSQFWNDVDANLMALGPAGGAIGGTVRGTGQLLVRARQLFATRVLPELPAALAAGQNAQSGISVYYGLAKNVRAYVGITNDLLRRQAEHAGNYVLDAITKGITVTRGQARAIEQALIVRNPHFKNLRNSISPLHDYYDDAVKWGEAWLKEHEL